MEPPGPDPGRPAEAGTGDAERATAQRNRRQHPSRKNSQNPLGALGLKILPLLQHQWLTRGMQHRRAHEGSNYPRRCQMASHWKTATGEHATQPAGYSSRATAHAMDHAVHPTPLAADQPGPVVPRSEDLRDTAR